MSGLADDVNWQWLMNAICITLLLWAFRSSSGVSRAGIRFHVVSWESVEHDFLLTVELGSGTGAGGTNPAAGSAIQSSLLGKAKNHGVWRSLGLFQTMDKNQSAPSPRTQNWAGFKRQNSRSGSQGSSLFYQPELLIESSKNLCWLPQEKTEFIIRWPGTCEIDYSLEDLAWEKGRSIHKNSIPSDLKTEMWKVNYKTY